MVTDRAEMRSICSAFSDRFKEKRLTHMIRRCLEAGFQDPDTISVAYETRYVREGQLLADDPYYSFTILRRRAGGWKISNMQFDVSSDSPANVTLRNWQAD